MRSKDQAWLGLGLLELQWVLYDWLALLKVIGSYGAFSAGGCWEDPSGSAVGERGASWGAHGGEPVGKSPASSACAWVFPGPWVGSQLWQVSGVSSSEVFIARVRFVSPLYFKMCSP